MGDAFLVRGFQGIENLAGIAGGLILGHGTGQGRAFDVFHHQVIRPDVVKLADVRVIERGDGAGLALEELIEFAFGCFDSDDAVQARVVGLPHFAHPSFAEGREDFVGTNSGTGQQRGGHRQLLSLPYCIRHSGS